MICPFRGLNRCHMAFILDIPEFVMSTSENEKIVLKPTIDRADNETVLAAGYII
jgi:hypothetical protein